ncbi:acyltransferase family protein [Pseudomonas sp. SDO52101_S400]
MGFIRFFLALSVMFSHIGPLSWIPVVPAGFAVNCFYLMSGFYITLGLNERYKTPNTNSEFYIGRVLRLWPVYLFSLFILIPTGMIEAVAHNISQQPLIIQAIATFSNIFMLGSDLLLHMSSVDGKVVFSEFGIDKAHNGAQNIINLPAWTLSIEILFYIAAPFIVRDTNKTLIFFATAALYTLAAKIFLSATSMHLRTDLYYLGPALYFALGAASYWIHRLYSDSINKTVAIYILAFAIVALCTAHTTQQSLTLIGLAALSPLLFEKTKNSKIDKWFGDLSYPLYITHIPVTIVVRWLGYFEANTFSYVVSIMFGTLIAVYAVELPIEKLRKNMRARKKSTLITATP